MMQATRFSRMCAYAGLALCVSGFAAEARQSDPYANLPAQHVLQGKVRDFRSVDVGGHADFQRRPTGGFGQYLGMVADSLDSEGKPVFASAGYRLSSQWKDAAGNFIMRPKSYINAKPGDVNGSVATSTGGASTNAANLAMWFRDTPNVNMSANLPITLKRVPNTNKYVFDDKADPDYVSKGGFFPINGALYGNYSSTGKNFHFTYELDTNFKYEKNKGHIFKFTGDDDVWVFIDGKLVIDIGGIHSAKSQTIEIDRLNWLQNGQTYSLKFFFAERHRTQSNCRIDTTMRLRSIDPPATTALFD